MTAEELYALTKNVSLSELAVVTAKLESMTNHSHYWDTLKSQIDENNLRTYECNVKGCLAKMTLPNMQYKFSLRKFYWDGQQVTPEELGVQRP